MHPPDIVDDSQLDKKQRILIFRLLWQRRSGGRSVYGYEQRHERRFDQCADGFELEEVMEEMYVDDTVDVLEEQAGKCSGSSFDGTLLYMKEDKCAFAVSGGQWAKDMNIEYISLRKEMTVADAILKIRQSVLIKRRFIHAM